MAKNIKGFYEAAMGVYASLINSKSSMPELDSDSKIGQAQSCQGVLLTLAWLQDLAPQQLPEHLQENYQIS